MGGRVLRPRARRNGERAGQRKTGESNHHRFTTTTIVAQHPPACEDKTGGYRLVPRPQNARPPAGSNDSGLRYGTMQMNAHTPNTLLLVALLVVGLAAAASAQRTIPAPSDVAAPPSDAATTSSGLAYGGRAGYPAGMLVFDIELIAIR